MSVFLRKLRGTKEDNHEENEEQFEWSRDGVGIFSLLQWFSSKKTLFFFSLRVVF